MSIKEKYNLLTTKDLNLNDFNQIIELKNQCIIELNQEYLYLCDILIIDIYINENLLEDALNITLKNLNNIDSIVFKRIHVSLLERAIYIYIHKKNFKSAYRYAFDKRNYIDLENIDEVNRWYLEMAYIYAELNQKDKALMNLKAIMNNYPNESLKALTLSNMTKLYIDEKQIVDAKNSLNDCITLVYKLDDEEGIAYCEYLNAKLHILEKNYKLAKQSFQDIFKNLNNLSDEYLSIANEFISLLIDMDLYDEAYRISVKYLKSIEKSDDIYVKKDYYKNYLKIYILKNKNVRDDLKELMKSIETLELEIEKTDNNISTESFEDDKILEVNSKVREVVLNVEKSINLVSLSLRNDEERDIFLELSKNLKEVSKFDEIALVKLTKTHLDVIPDFIEDFNKLKVYSIKDNKIDEKEFSYNNLNGTAVEMLISANHEIMLDFNESVIPLKNLMSTKSYVSENVKSLYALPMYNDKEIFACVIFTSFDSSLTDVKTLTYLKLAIKMFELKLVSLSYLENIRSQKTIISQIESELKEGVFYFNPENRKMVLSDKLCTFMISESRVVNYNDFLLRINEDDRKIYENVDRFIRDGEAYRIEYRVMIGDKEVLVSEKASPYISKNGTIRFYVGTISKLDNAVLFEYSNFSYLDIAALERSFHSLEIKTKEPDYKCMFLKLKINYNEVYSEKIKSNIFIHVYNIVSKSFKSQTFRLDINNIAVIDEKNDLAQVDKVVKNIFSSLDQGLIINNVMYHFDTKFSLVRFPHDTYNLNEVLEFLEITLESPQRFQVFNDEIHRLYLRRKQLSSRANEILRLDNVDLQLIELKTNQKFKAYEIRIADFEIFENPSSLLNDRLLVSFERLIIKTLIKKIDPKKDYKYYLSLSGKSLELLINDNFFKNGEITKYEKIVICLSDLSNNIDKQLDYLHNLGFKLYIDYRTALDLKLDTVLKNNFEGLYFSSDVKIEDNYLNVFKLLEFDLLGDIKDKAYQRIITRTNTIINFEDLS